MNRPITEENKKLSYRKETALSLFKFWQKYKCEKRASNIALCYGVDVDESSYYCSTAPCLYLMQN